MSPIDYLLLAKLHKLMDKWEVGGTRGYDLYDVGYNHALSKASEELQQLLQQHYSLANEEG